MDIKIIMMIDIDPQGNGAFGVTLIAEEVC
jgi:hypothetical protein